MLCDIRCRLRLLTVTPASSIFRRELSVFGSFNRALVENGVNDYSHERLVEDYRRGLFRHLVICVIGLGNVAIDSDGGRAILDVAIPRLAALTDWDCGEMIPG